MKNNLPSASWMCHSVCCTACYRKFKQLLMFIFFSAVSFPALAQSTSPPLDSYLSFDSTGVAEFYVQVPDTLAIASVEVAFGRDSSNFQFLHEYSFDVSSGLPSGLSYSRVGDKIYLGLGVQDRPNVFYGQVRLKNLSGVWSDPYSFLSN